MIHQPSPQVFANFDDVLFVAKGQIKYFGQPLQAFEYLPADKREMGELTNPADYLLEQVHNFEWSPHDPDASPSVTVPQRRGEGNSGDIRRRGLSSSAARFIPTKRGSGPAFRRRTPWFISQLWTFFKRAALQQKRDLRSFYINNILVVIAALLLGLSFRNSVFKGPVPAVEALQCPAWIAGQCALPVDDTYVTQWMLTSLALGLTAIASALGTFGNEKLVFWRESSVGTSDTAYFLGKDIANILSVIIPPGLYTLIYYPITQPVLPLLQMYWILLAVQYVCIGVSYFISVIMKGSTSLVIGVVYIFVSIILSGFHPNMNDLHKNLGEVGLIATWWSYARWAMEALYVGEVNQYKGIYEIQSGLSLWRYNGNSYWRNLIILVVMGVIARLLSWIGLKSVDSQKRGRESIGQKIQGKLQNILPRFLQPLVGVKH